MKKAIDSFLKRFKDKAQAFRVAQQAALYRQLAEMKAARRMKPAKSNKKAYEPGSIGVSNVTKEIMKQHDGILYSRKERRSMARHGMSKAFVPVYNNK